MTVIRYVNGDATAPPGQRARIIVHVCNDVGGWGRGFVVAVSRRWTEPEEHVPRIGCGLAGGRWEEIEPIVTAELVDHGISVTVYDFEPVSSSRLPRGMRMPRTVPSTSRRRKLVGRAALVVGTTVVALVLAEVVFRVQLAQEREESHDDGSWYERIRAMNRTIYRRSDDPALVYEPRPGSRFEMDYGVAGFNAGGMRDDREHPLEADGPRVALLGDSIVWSEHLPLPDSLPRRLEEELGRPVLSFGVTGYDTAQEAIWYERAVRRYHPDVVVLVYCMNDMMIMSGPYNRHANGEEARRKEAQDRMFERVAPVRRETLDQVARTEEDEATFKLLARLRALYRRATFDDHYIDEYTVTARDQARVRRVRAALARLGRAVTADGGRPVLVISPVLESWDHYHWSHIHALVRDAGEAAGFTVLDPLEQWRGQHDPASLRFPGDNLHYDAAGTRLLAATVARAL